MTALGDFNRLLKGKLEGTGIVVHALYRREKRGLAGKEYYLTGMFEIGDARKYFDVKMEKDALPSDKEAELLADDIAAQLRALNKPVILMN